MRCMLIYETLLGIGPIIEGLRPGGVHLLVGLVESLCRGVEVIHGLVIGIHVGLRSVRTLGVKVLFYLVKLLLLNIEIRELWHILFRGLFIEQQRLPAFRDQRGIALEWLHRVQPLQTFGGVAG